MTANSAGLNTFTFNVDFTSDFDEINELNNIATAQIMIGSSDIIPVFPYRYAIIPGANVTLKASTADPFAPERSYVFQVDTTDVFSAPLFQQTVKQKGGVVSCPIPFALKDSTVYFWRVSVKDSARWKESSFIYRPGKSGWSQAHIFQFKNDEFRSVLYNKGGRRIEFYDGYYVITASATATTWKKQELLINNGYLRQGSYGTINIAVFNPSNGRIWMRNPNPGLFGSINNSQYKDSIDAFDFNTNIPRIHDSIARFVSVIPKGCRVVVYTTGSNYGGNVHNINKASATLMGAFAAMGADTNLLRNTPGNVPFVLFGTKSANVGTARFYPGASSNDVVLQTDTLIVKYRRGEVASEWIGPAAKWTQMRWKDAPYPGEASSHSKDSISLRIVAFDKNGQEVILAKNILPQQSMYDLSSIDASQYPFLRLIAAIGDDSLRTAPQIRKWQIYYDPVPELAVNPSRYFSFYGNDVNEGDTIRLSVAVENVSEYDMDSVWIQAWNYDQLRNKTLAYHVKRRGLLASGKSPKDTLLLTVPFGTRGKPGNNALWIEANPRPVDRPEQFRFNNLLSLSYNVVADKTNPLLDVTFDGVHILDGDIVSARPEIQIRLNDENKYLALNDTSLLSVYLKDPEGNQRKLRFCNAPGLQCSSSLVTWFPAVSAMKNNFRLSYHPERLEDGTYELMVQATDVSKNSSGRIDYRIRFEVINKSTITEVLNYPNPFSTSTRFVFTLTGSEVPDLMQIQIMTVSGKVVREITRDELGPLHIGRNITDYAWDGKDQFGDQLANGLYLYRVVSRLNGAEIERRQSGADTWMTKGMGKMYLMR
jgi:hypothetical protein